MPPFLGDEMVIFGGAWSWMKRTTGDGSDSPPGPRIVTVKSLSPLVRVTGTIVVAPAIGTSLIGAGAWSFNAR